MGSSTISRIASTRSESGVPVRASASASASVSSIFIVSSVIIGSQRRQLLVGPGLRRPSQSELAQRLELLEREGGMAVQLQDRDESRDDDAGLADTAHELPEGEGLGAAQQRHDDGRLLPDADE